MTEDAMNEGLDGVSKLYFEGWVYGFMITKNLVELYHLKKFEERYKVTMDITALCGFGSYKTLEFEKAHHSKFKIIQNPLALLFHGEGRHEKIDHYLRGMNAGGGTIVHERMVSCIELECAAENGSHCLHLNCIDSLKDQLPQDLVSSQYDIEKLRPMELEFIAKNHDSPGMFTDDREVT
jgi:hypothetical protein